jgi:hypothetical protein
MKLIKKSGDFAVTGLPEFFIGRIANSLFERGCTGPKGC